MKVAHVMRSVSGTSIPVEIAVALDRYTDTTTRIVSMQEVGSTPDILRDDLVIEELCGLGSDRGLLKELSERGFDAVHTHHNRTAARISVHNTFTGNTTHFNTQHGHVHYRQSQKALNFVTLALADAFVYNSRTTRDSYNRIEGLALRGRPGFVAHNGVSEDVFSYHSDIDEVETVVTATRLIPRKNLSTLIRAFKHLPDLRLKIIGDGPQRERLEEFAGDHGLGDQVEFLGYISDRQDVYRQMEEADVFCLPSHGEGFCVAAAEAMAIGLPVVVSDLPVFHEVVNEPGVYVDRNSQEEIADAIRNLQDNPREARNRGRDGRARIRNRFTLDRTAENYENAYEQVLGR